MCKSLVDVHRRMLSGRRAIPDKCIGGGRSQIVVEPAIGGDDLWRGEKNTKYGKMSLSVCGERVGSSAIRAE